MKAVKAGDKVRIINNSIFEMMGLTVVTGTVFLLYPNGKGFGIKCDQTKAIETCDFGDGEIELI